MFAILDIETTGGGFNQEGITEIAIYKFDGEKVVDKFISLINPMRPIEWYVAKLTGINNKMLRRAPRFHEVAKRIVQITEGCTIVAHNAEFDYRVIRQEFARLGYEFNRNTLCTVKLSEELIPGMESYGLAKLTHALGIPLSNQHRAFGDAEATVELFKILLEKDTSKKILKAALKPVKRYTDDQRRLIRILDSLPTGAGIAYVHDKEDRIILALRTKNIYKEINQLFIRNTNLARQIKAEVERVTYQLTGSEMIASLIEKESLEKLRPKYNRKKIKTDFSHALVGEKNSDGYLSFRIKRVKRLPKDSLSAFYSLREARRAMDKWHERFGLNPTLTDFCVLKTPPEPRYTESAETYNQKASRFIGFLKEMDDMIFIDKGRQPNEKSVILTRDGRIRGYGYCNLNHQWSNLEVLEKIITPVKDDLNSVFLIHNFILYHRFEKIVPIEKNK